MPQRPRFVVPLLAVAGFAFAAWTAYPAPAKDVPPPPVAPSRTPYAHTVAGSAIVEPAGERTTALGAPFAALVLEVMHRPGDRVAKGDPLFRLDDRPLLAQRVVLESAALAARARLDRLLALPRAEDLPPLEARVASARASAGDRKAQLARLERAATAAPRAIPEEDVERARWAAVVADSAVAAAEADLVRAKQGAWDPDLTEARAAVAQAEAAMEENRRYVDRATVRAPFDGTVLECNVHPGEFATANRDALILFGDLSTLCVRVDVDEESAPLVRGSPAAVAFVRGFPETPLPLDFVRVEPWIRPKRSLTGATSERVDTRVLQVIFRVGASALPVRVGQQVDVYMEAAPRDEIVGARPGESVK